MTVQRIVFHSSHDPEVVADLLQRSMDPEKLSFFSLSGWKGSRSIVGDVRADTFRMRRRRNYKNDFAPVLHGSFGPEPGGTIIHAQVGAPRWSQLFMRVWLAGAVTLGVPIFVFSAHQAMSGSGEAGSNLWVDLLLPPALILFGILISNFGQFLGSGDKRIFIEHIERTITARMEQ